MGVIGAAETKVFFRNMGQRANLVQVGDAEVGLGRNSLCSLNVLDKRRAIVLPRTGTAALRRAWEDVELEVFHLLCC